MLKPITLEQVQPSDITAAQFVGAGHPYWGLDSVEMREVVYARERQLELALSMLGQRNRKKVGA